MCVDRRPVRALLVDGTIIRVRALDEADAQLVAAFYRELPVYDRYLRFFSAGVLPAAEDVVTSREPTDVSLGAFRDETLIGVAECLGTPPRCWSTSRRQLSSSWCVAVAVAAAGSAVFCSARSAMPPCTTPTVPLPWCDADDPTSRGVPGLIDHRLGTCSRRFIQVGDACAHTIGCDRLTRGYACEGAELVDPVTLVVTAVALGASAGMTETASNVIKDAYTGLKRLLTQRQVDPSGVERRPDSKAQKEALQETLADTPGAVDQELLSAAQQVTDAVATHHPDAAEAVGVDLRNVQAEFIRVQSITSAGTGFRGEGLTVQGGVDLGDVRAGRFPGGAGPSER